MLPCSTCCAVHRVLLKFATAGIAGDTDDEAGCLVTASSVGADSVGIVRTFGVAGSRCGPRQAGRVQRCGWVQRGRAG